MKKIVCLALALVLSLSFAALASGDFVCTATSVANGATNVYYKEGKVSITFNDEVNTVLVSMKKAGAAFVDFTATRNAVNTNVVDVVFDNDSNPATPYYLDFNVRYEIDFSGCKKAGDIAVSGINKIEFTVEPAPILEVESSTLISGVGTSTITHPSYFTGDNSLQGCTINLKNKDASNSKTVTIVCALYDDNGLIDKMVTSKKVIAAGSSDTIGLGTIIPTTVSGGKAKLFIWNDVSEKRPYVGSIEYDIQ
ncbi:MAG: hypothetical protein WCX81_01860 [Monoglobales bacterium]